jgi:hypothetical protein
LLNEQLKGPLTNMQTYNHGNVVNNAITKAKDKFHFNFQVVIQVNSIQYKGVNLGIITQVHINWPK